MEHRRGEIIFERILPYSFVVDVTVRGDIVLTQLLHEFGAILMNWRTGKSVLVRLYDSEVSTGQKYVLRH